MKKTLTIIGARPQFIKAAMLSKVLKGKFQEIIVHTGQHYDKNMSDIFFEQMKIPKPHYNLNVGSGSHAYQTGNMLIEIEKILLKEKPDTVIVYGDTNSTLAGALAASKVLIPIIHVESGLRSYNREMPEEQNRVLTDHISNILFCPTENAVENLKKEGIYKNVFNVGDIMCDSTIYYSKLADEKFNNEKLKLEYISNKKDIKSWYLLTLHRAENTRDLTTLEQVLTAMENLDDNVIYPIHPRVKEMFNILNDKYHYKNIIAIEPVDYMTMLYLTKNAKKVITDSGGLQKECYILNTPCITVRTETEWIETLNNGFNILSSPDSDEIIQKINSAKISITNKTNYFGEGNTASEILKEMEKLI